MYSLRNSLSLSLMPIEILSKPAYSGEASLYKTINTMITQPILLIFNLSLFVFDTTALPWTRASSFPRFLDQTQRRTRVGRTPLDEGLARRRDLYLTTHTTLTTDKRPCPRRNLNPQSQQARGRRPTP
jgi:hypothetical protein